MRDTKKVNSNSNKIITSYTPDKTEGDNDADKSGTDTSSDNTEIRKGANKFDKPRREVDPDRTGLDINSDKTKKNISK